MDDHALGHGHFSNWDLLWTIYLVGQLTTHIGLASELCHTLT